MAYLELKGIRKSYKLNKGESFSVLKGVTADFDSGEFVSIVGESGGGKSTLMNIIGGLDHNYRGDVVIDGKSTKHFSESQMDSYRRETIGFIFQSFNLISHLSALDNVLLSLEMTTLSQSERVQRAKDLLDQVGLKEHKNKLPNQLSGGQKQRVAIARALASDPDVIIADEPTGALDSKNTQEVLKILQEISDDGKLVIVVTHSNEVAKFGSRIIRLEDGVISEDEIIKEVKTSDEPVKKPFESKKLDRFVTFTDSFKHLRFTAFQDFLIILGSAIGLFAVLLFSGIGNGTNNFMEDQIYANANPNLITVFQNNSKDKKTDDTAQSAMFETMNDISKSSLSDTDLDKMKSFNGVKTVEGVYNLGEYTAYLNDKLTAGFGLRTWSSGLNADQVLKDGKAPLNENEIVIDENTAKEIFGSIESKDVIGKELNIDAQWIDNNKAPIEVDIKNQKVTGISKGEAGTGITTLNYQTTRNAISSQNGRVAPNFVSVITKNIDDVQKITNDIADVKSDDNYSFSAFNIGSTLDTIQTYVTIATTVLSAIAGISLIVSTLMIIVTTYMSVNQRTKEIGVRRAIGEGKKDISRLFTYESLTIGLFSALLSTILAYGFGALFNNLLFGLMKTNIVVINPGNVLFIFIISLIISFFGALFPARKASKLDPIKSLASE